MLQELAGVFNGVSESAAPGFARRHRLDARITQHLAAPGFFPRAEFRNRSHDSVLARLPVELERHHTAGLGIEVDRETVDRRFSSYVVPADVHRAPFPQRA